MPKSAQVKLWFSLKVLDLVSNCETFGTMELVLRYFDCSLEFVFSLLLLQPFSFSPVSFACNFQDWGCVILREIDFPLVNICSFLGSPNGPQWVLWNDLHNLIHRRKQWITAHFDARTHGTASDKRLEFVTLVSYHSVTIKNDRLPVRQKP